MSPINYLAAAFKSLKDFRLSYPLNREFSQNATWWFTSIASVVVIITMLLVSAASAYEAISIYSRDFNTTSPLWYEILLANATSSLGLSPSRVCSSSVIELGSGTQSTLPMTFELLRCRVCDYERVHAVSTCVLYR